MTNSPNWVSYSLQLGLPDVAVVDTGIVGSDGVARPTIPVGTIAQFRDIGTTQFGTGAFIYLPGVTSTVAGDLVVYRTPTGAGADINGGSATIRATATGNTGFPVAVATAATNIQTTWGWYQIQGSAIINITGTVSAGQSAYIAQTATVGTTAAGGKQLLGMQSVSASDLPTTGKAVFTINNPTVQSQIT